MDETGTRAMPRAATKQDKAPAAAPASKPAGKK
jgi:hypothetical protein